MDPMIEPPSSQAHVVEEFYDRLAHDYDTMTTYEKRFFVEEPFFRLLVQRYRITSALDAGCGTGFHSVLLARLGLRVTAVDISQRMLDELLRHSAELKLGVTTVRAEFRDIPALVADRFDAVFCMGNSLPHLLTPQDLRSSLEAFGRVLTPGGLLFLQVLNYDRILRTRPEIQNVKETDRGTFIRSYQFSDETIQFSIRKTGGGAGEDSLQSVRLRPVLSAELSTILAAVGFGEIHLFGSVAMEEFDPAVSKDLVILAKYHTAHPGDGT
jgi:glycine/sarcosine N-methyltransferase